jgi:ArsR family metal-binding transcriptional regulator
MAVQITAERLMMKSWESKDIETLDRLEIYALLPKTNCRRCGFDTCLAFAAAVEEGKRPITSCRVLDQSER